MAVSRNKDENSHQLIHCPPIISKHVCGKECVPDGVPILMSRQYAICIVICILLEYYATSQHRLSNHSQPQNAI